MQERLFQFLLIIKQNLHLLDSSFATRQYTKAVNLVFFGLNTKGDLLMDLGDKDMHPVTKISTQCTGDAYTIHPGVNIYCLFKIKHIEDPILDVFRFRVDSIHMSGIKQDSL